MPSMGSLERQAGLAYAALAIVYLVLGLAQPVQSLRFSGADGFLPRWLSAAMPMRMHTMRTAALPTGTLISPKSQVIHGIGQPGPLMAQPLTASGAAAAIQDDVMTVFNEDALIALRRAARQAQTERQREQHQQQMGQQQWDESVLGQLFPDQQQRLTPEQQQQQQPGGEPDFPFGTSQPPTAAFLPRDKSAAFDPERAALLATLQSIAYCADTEAVKAWTCTRCGKAPGFQPTLVHFDEAWDLMGYAGYLPSLNAKVLVFRGTDSSSWYNWAENMRAWRTDATYPIPGAPTSLRIHSGFNVLWNSSSMAPTFLAAARQLQQAHPGGPTYILGHSMGGALAHLCALDLRVAFGPSADLRVYTFGSPRVGNAVFAEFFNQHVAQSWRFTHSRDIVPSVPPMYMGFRHVSREVWLVDVDSQRGLKQERIIVCDESGEDPTCHSSVCHLGLCTSIADHLVYLSARMFAHAEC